MLRALACTILILAGSTTRAECECLWQGSFSEVQAGADLVVSGAVISARGNSIDLSVDRLLRGRAHRDNLRVWLKTGDYCRPEPGLFPIGSQWLMALHRIERDVPGGFNPHTPNVSYGRVGDYSLSSCGGYWLEQSGDWITGNLVNAPRWVRDPVMTPVLVDLVADYVDGKIDVQVLLQASREDPAMRELMLDTREFLRGDLE
ncbi:MAG: delta-aminolevulinic acid dehydratase [Gammaproteobacteria bacterium]|nr:MAG: delta-aminolevulinic acid dehydratase [Gammaproteobacteria bacterium]